jgi:dTDP-4-dehydrorhamnose 3,5-epimerase
MPIKVTKQSLPGVLLIEPQVFDDDRGFFLETYHRKKYAEWGIEGVFVQDNHSNSRKGTLRGLHYQLQHPQAKLIYVVSGEIFDVAVDIRRGSPTFGQWTGTILSGENKYQLYVPEGFAHGFCVLSETVHVMYKCTDLYAPGDEYGILWSDPTINIVWPIENPILSKKDSQNPKVREISEDCLPAFRKIAGD